MEGIRPPTPSHKSVVVDNGGKQAHLGGNCDSTSRECLQETFGWVHSVSFVGNQAFKFYARNTFAILSYLRPRCAIIPLSSTIPAMLEAAGSLQPATANRSLCQ